MIFLTRLTAYTNCNSGDTESVTCCKTMLQNQSLYGGFLFVCFCGYNKADFKCEVSSEKFFLLSGLQILLFNSMF